MPAKHRVHGLFSVGEVRENTLPGWGVGEDPSWAGCTIDRVSEQGPSPLLTARGPQGCQGLTLLSDDIAQPSQAPTVGGGRVPRASARPVWGFGQLSLSPPEQAGSLGVGNGSARTRPRAGASGQEEGHYQPRIG